MPTVVILAGGEATRLSPVTKAMPKSMVELEGRPFIAHQLEILKKNDVKRVVICAGYLGHMVKDYIHKAGDLGLKVEFSFDGDKLLGTAGAIRKALPLLENDFAVMYGDSYLTEDFRPIAGFFLKSGKKGLMTVFKNENKWDISNIVFDGGQLVKYDKKNLTKEMKYIDYGLLFFKKEVFSKIIEGRVADLADLCTELVNGGHMAGYEVKTRFYEIGSFQGLEDTKKYLQNTSEG